MNQPTPCSSTGLSPYFCLYWRPCLPLPPAPSLGGNNRGRVDSPLRPISGDPRAFENEPDRPNEPERAPNEPERSRSPNEPDRPRSRLNDELRSRSDADDARM